MLFGTAIGFFQTYIRLALLGWMGSPSSKPLWTSSTSQLSTEVHVGRWCWLWHIGNIYYDYLWVYLGWLRLFAWMILQNLRVAQFENQRRSNSICSSSNCLTIAYDCSITQCQLTCLRSSTTVSDPILQLNTHSTNIQFVSIYELF